MCINVRWTNCRNQESHCSQFLVGSGLEKLFGLLVEVVTNGNLMAGVSLVTLVRAARAIRCPTVA